MIYCDFVTYFRRYLIVVRLLIRNLYCKLLKNSYSKFFYYVFLSRQVNKTIKSKLYFIFHVVLLSQQQQDHQ